MLHTTTAVLQAGSWLTQLHQPGVPDTVVIAGVPLTDSRCFLPVYRAAGLRLPAGVSLILGFRSLKFEAFWKSTRWAKLFGMLGKLFVTVEC